MNNTNISAQSEQFYIDCEVIETKYEYPQYTGVEKWIIITDLTEEELKGKYAEQIAPLKPFIVLPRSSNLQERKSLSGRDIFSAFARSAVLNSSAYRRTFLGE